MEETIPEPIRISISKDESMLASRQSHFWSMEIKSMQHLSQIMLHKVWSPIVWEDGVRLKDTFKSSGLIALDFDDGRLTIQAALRLCGMSRVAFVLGTSKSHQKEKTTKTGKISPPVDRFRLVYKVSSITRRRDLYEHTLGEIMEIYPCDASCKDAGRFFFPCKEIVAVSEGPSILDWVEPDETEKERRDRFYAAVSNEVPGWIVSALRYGTGEGGRHKLCYRIGAALILRGFTEQQIIDRCKQSPLGEIGGEEIERAVLNGADRGIRDYEEWKRAHAHQIERSGPEKEKTEGA